ncbi:hypothetical protein ARMGADRAFT_477953 [Armillaria gallica]|uniref:Secreted protein n=1 Tax=Armillaria gallica TaxID=47427 RepID=A0A2H3DEL6_ARMGA|nr:hypothetical protein ARMGADRAFT_477953 [Armillaria gallica]
MTANLPLIYGRLALILCFSFSSCIVDVSTNGFATFYRVKHASITQVAQSSKLRLSDRILWGTHVFLSGPATKRCRGSFHPLAIVGMAEVHCSTFMCLSWHNVCLLCCRCQFDLYHASRISFSNLGLRSRWNAGKGPL